MSSFKKSVLIGLLWSFGGRFIYIIIGFLTNVILARILMPEEFGRVGIAMTFVVIANVLSESGFSGALVRKLDVDNKDFYTAFIFNILVSFLLYFLLYISAVYIAKYYNDMELENIIKMSSLVIIINAFSMVQNAKANIALAYKKLAKITVLSIILSSFTAIILAFYKFGVWSIVIMQLINSICLSSLLWFSFGRIKKDKFSLESLRYLFSFGGNTTIALFLNRFFDSVYQLVIGRFFSMNDVGLFYQGKKIQEVPLTFIRSVSSSVLFSALSKVQKNKDEFTYLYSRFIAFLASISCLVTAIVYTYSTHIIYFIYGEKWKGAIPYIEILIIASFFYALETFNRIIFKTYNKTKKILFLEILKKIFQSITILIGIIFKDIIILLYGYILTNIFSYLLNLYFAKKIIVKLRWREAFNVFKTLMSAILVTIIFKYVVFIYYPELIINIMLLPIFMICYFLLLKYLNIMDIKLEFNRVLMLIRDRN